MSADELDRLDPQPTEFTLEDGTKVRIKRLRTRQFFKLLRIVTHGGMYILPTIDLNLSAGSDEFAQQMVSLLIFAIPEAEDETIEFVRAMLELVEDAEPEGTGRERETQKQANARVLFEATEDLSMDDLISVIEAVIRTEADDIKALGNRLRTMLEVAQKTGQTEMSSKMEKPTEETAAA